MAWLSNYLQKQVGCNDLSQFYRFTFADSPVHVLKTVSVSLLMKYRIWLLSSTWEDLRRLEFNSASSLLHWIIGITYFDASQIKRVLGHLTSAKIYFDTDFKKKGISYLSPLSWTHLKTRFTSCLFPVLINFETVQKLSLLFAIHFISRYPEKQHATKCTWIYNRAAVYQV